MAIRHFYLLLILLQSLGTYLGAQEVVLENIVPDRFIVVYRDASVPVDAEDAAQAAGAHILKRQERLGMATVALSRHTGMPPVTARVTSSQVDGEVMHRLASQSNVQYVLHDRMVTGHHLRTKTMDSPSAVFTIATGGTTFDTYYNSPQGWAVRQAGGYGNGVPGGPASGPWDATTGKGVRIAIIDSGVDASHPDIAPNLALNLTEIDQSALSSICDDGSPQDQSGHGTWTASLAAGALGTGTGRVAGVAPSASILNIKVLERVPASISGTDTARCSAGESSGLLSWVIQGIDDALANRADIISMSLGTIVDLSTGDGAGIKSAFDRITYAANQAGAVLIAAAGNDGYNLANPRYFEIPAQSRNVLAVVASTNPDCMEDTRSNICKAGSVGLTYYSNYGVPLNALAAPGGSYPVGGDTDVSGWIRGACSSGLPNTLDGLPNDAMHSFGCFSVGHADYIQAIGTSASAPLVAGAAALLKAAHPEWDAMAVVNALRTTAASATQTLPAPQINVAAALGYQQADVR